MTHLPQRRYAIMSNSPGPPVQLHNIPNETGNLHGIAGPRRRNEDLVTVVFTAGYKGLRLPSWITLQQFERFSRRHILHGDLRNFRF